MFFDRRRVRERLLLGEDELASHHREVFACSANTALKVTGAELRADDAPGVIAELCWVSPMRDLREDLSQGLINLPREILDPHTQTLALSAAGKGPDSPEIKEILANARVKAWLGAQYEAVLGTIRQTDEELAALKGRRGCAGFRIFHFLLKDYAGRYPRKYPEVFL